MEKKQQYITPSGLKQRGWTDTMIVKYLGDPDETKANPYYKSAAPMRLYDLKRVERAEKRKAFIADREASDRRKQSAAKGVATKREKAVEYARTVAINVPRIGYDTLLKHACRHYNGWHECRPDGSYDPDFIPADPKHSDPDFLHRIATNYLRHECTSYDDELYKLFGKTGVHEAHDILQRRINKEIRATYPQLNDNPTKKNIMDELKDIERKLSDEVDKAVDNLLFNLLTNTTREVYTPDPTNQKTEE